jgi:lysophospholipase L1-like esterase
MIEIARANKTFPIVGTVPPRKNSSGENRHAGINERIRLLCEEEKVTLADVEAAFNEDYTLMMPDGYHPNEDGNLLIAIVFHEALP